ncbi:MAG TPA: hypothetical protein VGR15_04070, partial [Bacteroidota bacterium]|nr:hypothetical protein [Bacteroidota bacterium]
MRSLLATFLIVSNIAAQEKSSDWSQRRTLPRWGRQEFSSHNLGRDYTVTYRIYPSYFRGDFNGDGRGDIAFFVENKISRKTGMVIIHGKRIQAIRTQYVVLGAGKPLEGAGDDLKWIAIWSLILERKADRILGKQTPSTLRGDALKVERREGKAGLIYWD